MYIIWKIQLQQIELRTRLLLKLTCINRSFDNNSKEKSEWKSNKLSPYYTTASFCTCKRGTECLKAVLCAAQLDKFYQIIFPY
jgi:hypothetical protein